MNLRERLTALGEAESRAMLDDDEWLTFDQAAITWRTLGQLRISG